MKTIRTGERLPAPTTPTMTSQKGNTKRNSTRAAYATFALVPGVLMGTSHACAEGLLVPSYIYPVGTGTVQWSALATAATSVPITVILNPNSGPGTTQDVNYVAVVTKMHAADGKVIGYVSNSYANRPLSAVVRGINVCQALYQVDGFFIDEMMADSITAHMQFHQSVHNYVKRLSPNYAVTGNPDTNVSKTYASLPVTGQLVVFGDSARRYASYMPLTWQTNYPTACFAYIVCATSAVQTQTFVRNASSKGAAVVFIANETLPNPYDTPPIHWSREVSTTVVAP